MKKLCLLLALLLLTTATSRAATSSGLDSGGGQGAELQNPFSDYVPFEEESDVDEMERFMYFGRFFGIALGTGMHTFGGNIGKLYNTSIPVIDARLQYFFDFRFAGMFGISSASHAFVTDDDGLVEVNLFRINADLKYYLDTRDMAAPAASANPFLIAGIGNTFRSTTFQDNQTQEKDTAVAASVGAGMEFSLKPRKTSLGVEGRVHQIFFKDRYSDSFASSGVKDTTGQMYSLIVNLLFFF